MTAAVSAMVRVKRNTALRVVSLGLCRGSYGREVPEQKVTAVVVLSVELSPLKGRQDLLIGTPVSGSLLSQYSPSPFDQNRLTDVLNIVFTVHLVYIKNKTN
jgi:hypothetical protein